MFRTLETISICLSAHYLNVDSGAWLSFRHWAVAGSAPDSHVIGTGGRCTVSQISATIFLIWALDSMYLCEVSDLVERQNFSHQRAQRT